MKRIVRTSAATILGLLGTYGCLVDGEPEPERVGATQDALTPLNGGADSEPPKPETETVPLPATEPGECICTLTIEWWGTPHQSGSQDHQHPDTNASWSVAWAAGEGVPQLVEGGPQGDWRQSRTDEDAIWDSPGLSLRTEENIRVDIECVPPPDAPAGAKCTGGIGVEFESDVHIKDVTVGGLTASKDAQPGGNLYWFDDGAHHINGPYADGETAITTVTRAIHKRSSGHCGDVMTSAWSSEGCDTPTGLKDKIKELFDNIAAGSGQAVDELSGPLADALDYADTLFSVVNTDDCWRTSSGGAETGSPPSQGESEAHLNAKCSEVLPCEGTVFSKVTVYNGTSFLATGGMPPGWVRHLANMPGGGRGLRLKRVIMEPGCFARGTPPPPPPEHPPPTTPPPIPPPEPPTTPGTPTTPPPTQPPDPPGPPTTGCVSDDQCPGQWPCCIDGACQECPPDGTFNEHMSGGCSAPFAHSAEIVGECCEHPAPAYGMCCYEPGSPASMMSFLPEAGPCP